MTSREANVLFTSKTSLKTRIRWILSSLKRNLFVPIRRLRGFKQYEAVVPIERMLLGQQAKLSIKDWVRLTGTHEFVSRPMTESPHVRFLLDVIADEARLNDAGFLERHPYFEMAHVIHEHRGSFFGRTTSEGIREQMKLFYQMYRDVRDGKPEATTGIDNPHQTARGLPIMLSKAVSSDCYEIKDGHHRTAIACALGKKEVRATVVAERPTYLQSFLLECLQVKGPELYQPVNRLEVRDWRLVRKCTDRFELIREYLNQSGLAHQISTVLDLPCSYGWFVFQFKELGYSAFGLERDPAAIQVGKMAYGLTESEIRQGEIVDFLGKRERQYDLVLFLSILHHFALDQEHGDENEILRKLDEITGEVLILDTGENHESWFKHKIPQWDVEFIEKKIRENTSFREIVRIGKDTDNEGDYGEQYGRTLFACRR